MFLLKDLVLSDVLCNLVPYCRV